MRKIISYLFFLLFCISHWGLEAKVKPESIRAINVYSGVFDEDKELRVYLPDGYESSYASFPVIYIMDGTKYFDTMVEVVDFMIENHSMPPHIVVGFDNIVPLRDMTPEAPSMHKRIYPMRGGANRFMEALEKEIIPEIGKQFRTRSQNVIVGHDFSGVFAFHVMITNSELFDRYLLFSPNIWWDNGALVDKFEEFITKKLTFRKRMYMSIGLEGKQQLFACEKLVGLLKNSTPSDFVWDFEWMADETHYSLVKKSMMSGLEKIFDDYRFPTEKELVEGGFEKLKSYKGTVLLNYGRDIKVPYTLLKSVGDKFLEQGREDEAILFLEEGVRLYPASGEALFFLGKAYEKTNNLPMAKLYFEQAHKMAPERKDFEVKLFRLMQPVRDSISELIDK
ncbi:MAG: alpha/beta hydrolase-fold protein [Marinifilaceae bacterium]